MKTKEFVFTATYETGTDTQEKISGKIYAESKGMAKIYAGELHPFADFIHISEI